MLPKPNSDLNYSEVDDEFSVSETPNIFNKVPLNGKKHRKQSYILTG